MKFFKKQIAIDYILLGLVTILVVIGIFMVYSASSYSAEVNYDDKYYFLKKQVIGVLLGFIGLVVCCFVNIEKLKKLKWLFLVVSIAFLVIVFIPGVGKSSYGASRWINLGFITIQPSEIAKFGFVFFSAAQLSELRHDPKKFRAMIPVLLSGGMICLLIILEPNMSVTMCVGMTMLVMLFVGGCSLKTFALILIPVLLAVPLLIVLEPYRLQRLSAFIDPWSAPLDEGFQLIQSYYALGSGGLFGVGYGNSRQKNLFLPFSESDFIFAIMGEELGFFVCVLIMAVYALIIIRGYKIAANAKTRFQCYLTTGVISVIAIQTLLNIAVVTGSIPPTGLPLPFISAGSTSLLVFMSAIGVVLNVDRQSRKNRI